MLHLIVIHLEIKTYLKNRPESITESKISDLSQQLPKRDEWQDFLSNYNVKFQLTNSYQIT